jgi:hypothetical protein
MPLPVLGPLAAPVAIVVVKKLAFQAAAYIDVWLPAIFALWAWKKIPDWIREDISFKSLLRNNQEREELSYVGSVIDKLQAQIDAAKGMEPVPQLHAAILAYIQLSGQLKLQQLHADAPAAPAENGVDDFTKNRDILYKTSGEPFSLASLQTKEFREALHFSTIAYYDSSKLTSKLETMDYTLLEHSLSSRPGNVAYFVAISSEQKKIIVGIRGTSSLEELLTDCCGRAVPFQDIADGDYEKARIEVRAAIPNTVCPSPDGCAVEVVSGHERIIIQDHDDEGDNFIRCHEGILLSARRLVGKVQPSIEKFVLECDYRLILCGHSLGAGAAALAAIILRSRLSFLAKEENNDKMRVYAFAPPPILDHDAAVAASSFCTSIVNNADIVPRSSLANLMVLLEFLRHIHARLEEAGMNPTGPVATAAFLKKLGEGSGGEMLMSHDEVMMAMKDAHDKVELRKQDHLYIPGRVLLAYTPWRRGNDEQVDVEKDGVLLGTEGELEVKMKDSDNESELKGSEAQRPSGNLGCIATDGTAPALRFFEVDGARMLMDHLSSSYYAVMGMPYDF